MSNKLASLIKIIFYSPLYLFSLIVLFIILLLSIVAYHSLVSPFENYYSVIIFTIYLLVPLLFTYQKETNHDWWNKKSWAVRIVYLIILIPTFIISRLIIIGFIAGGQKYLVNRNIGIEWLLSLIFIGLDTLYWYGISNNITPKEKEPYLWYTIKHIIIEAFILASFYLFGMMIIEYFLPTL